MSLYRFSIDCVPNDPVDVRAGGPRYLGYDFTIETDDPDAELAWLISEVKAQGIPVQDSVYRQVVNRVWTREEIVAEIASAKRQGKLIP